MRAGKLRHLITIEVQSATEDAHGERLDSWSTLVQRYASVEPLNGREFFSKSGEQSEITTRMRMRHDTALDAVTPGHRVNFNSVIYDIQSIINPQEIGKELILMCVRNG